MHLYLVPEGGYEWYLMLRLVPAGSKGKTLGLFLLELFFAEAKKSGKALRKFFSLNNRQFVAAVVELVFCVALDPVAVQLVLFAEV